MATSFGRRILGQQSSCISRQVRLFQTSQRQCISSANCNVPISNGLVTPVQARLPILFQTQSIRTFCNTSITQRGEKGRYNSQGWGKEAWTKDGWGKDGWQKAATLQQVDDILNLDLGANRALLGKPRSAEMLLRCRSISLGFGL